MLVDGVPNQGTVCDRTIRGDAFPFLPKLRGTLTTSPLLQTIPGNLSCKYDLVSGENQSVVVTMVVTSPSKDCRTVCDGTGCRCSHHTGDQVTLHSHHTTQCACGDYTTHLHSLDKVTVVYTARDRRTNFSANYEFIKTRKVNCGTLHFNSTSGRIKRFIQT